MNVNKGHLNINFAVLIFLFPILPQFIYVVGGINMVNFTVILFLLSVIVSARIAKIHISQYLPLFWIYELFRCVLLFIDGEAIRGAASFLSFFVVPYLLIGCIKSKNKFFSALDIVILGGVVLGIFGIFEQITRFNIFQYFSDGSIEFAGNERYGLLRVMTTFGQPIGYGLYQVFISAIIYYRLNSDLSGKRKTFYYVAYVISVVNIVLSVSRTPLLAYILLQSLLIFQKSKKKFVNWAFVGVIILLIGGVIGDVTGIKIPLLNDIIQSFTNLFQGVTQTSEQTVGFGDRFNLWIWVADSMEGNWLFGNGATAEFAYEVYEWQIKTSIENHYLFTIYQYGLIGVFILVSMYISILFYAKKCNHKYGLRMNEKRLSLNKTFLIVFIVYNLIELGVQETDLTRLYVVLIALLISYNRIADKEMRESNIQLVKKGA